VISGLDCLVAGKSQFFKLSCTKDRNMLMTIQQGRRVFGFISTFAKTRSIAACKMMISQKTIASTSDLKIISKNR